METRRNPFGLDDVHSCQYTEISGGLVFSAFWLCNIHKPCLGTSQVQADQRSCRLFPTRVPELLIAPLRIQTSAVWVFISSWPHGACSDVSMSSVLYLHFFTDTLASYFTKKPKTLILLTLSNNTIVCLFFLADSLKEKGQQKMAHSQILTTKINMTIHFLYIKKILMAHYPFLYIFIGTWPCLFISALSMSVLAIR